MCQKANPYHPKSRCRAGLCCLAVVLWSATEPGRVLAQVATTPLEIALYAGVKIAGTVGERYRIEYRTEADGGESWKPLMELELPTSPYIFYDPAPGREPRRIYRTVALGPVEPRGADFVWCPPARFDMGSPATEGGRSDNEGPVTTVRFSRGFLIAQYEVTQRTYEAVMGHNPSFFKGSPDRPVDQVSWHDAVAFCERLTRRERAAGRLPQGYVYRLPTEAEWEYACRAGTTSRFSWGDSDEEATVKEHAWYEKNAREQTWTSPHAENEGHQVVGRKQPNVWGIQNRYTPPLYQWGLYDMHGNVSEWCLDWDGPYSGSSVTDPQGPPTGTRRVLRGGSWLDEAGRCRSASRDSADPSQGASHVGFRLVLGPVANPRLVWISPGTFTFGSAPCEEHRDPDEWPQTVVTFTYGFWMSRYETTQEEYLAIVGHNPSMFAMDPNRPVENVTWDEAMAYCEKLTEREQFAGRLPADHVFRLPREMEWEYACRAGTTTLFSFGLDSCFQPWTDYVPLLGEYAWTSHNSATVAHPQGETRPVGLKKPNPWGLYDMHGNVWEYTLDYDFWYPGGRITCDVLRRPWGQWWCSCLRGGAWHINGYGCRVADRQCWPHDRSVKPYGSFGFRPVLVPTQP